MNKKIDVINICSFANRKTRKHKSEEIVWETLTHKASMLSLKCINGVHNGDLFLLNKSEIQIGREKRKNSISLFKDECVSSIHCRIFISNSKLVQILDLGSLNGTFLKGERLISQKVYNFEIGDNIKIGESELQLKFCDKIMKTPSPRKVDFGVATLGSHRHFTRRQKSRVSTISRTAANFDGRPSPFDKLHVIKSVVVEAFRPGATSSKINQKRVKFHSSRGRSLSPPPYFQEDHMSFQEPIPFDLDSQDVSTNSKSLLLVIVGMLFSLLLFAANYFSFHQQSEIEMMIDENVIITKISVVDSWPDSVISDRALMVSRTSASYAFREFIDYSTCWWLPPPSGSGFVRISFEKCMFLSKVKIFVAEQSLIPLNMSIWSSDRRSLIGEIMFNERVGYSATNVQNSQNCYEQLDILVTGGFNQVGTCVHKVELFHSK